MASLYLSRAFISLSLHIYIYIYICMAAFYHHGIFISRTASAGMRMAAGHVPRSRGDSIELSAGWGSAGITMSISIITISTIMLLLLVLLLV